MNVFFADNDSRGLNETSAAHLCAVAAQKVTEYEAILSNINFVNTTVGLIGSSETLKTSIGLSEDQLSTVNRALSRICEFNAFIAWFAEARKELESQKTQIDCLDINDWIVMPTRPTAPKMPTPVSMTDVINNLSIKDRQSYLSLEAEAAAYGKFIHPDRPLDEARKKMHLIVNKPYDTKGTGRDTLVYSYTASMPTSVIDTFFERLQTKYRSIEQSLNKMKSDLRKEVDRIDTEVRNAYQDALNEYEKERADYDAAVKRVTTNFNQYKADEKTRLSKVKFIIPDALKSTYEYLNSLGK